MKHGFDIDGGVRAPAAVAVLRTPHSGGMLPALLAELNPAAVSVVLCGSDRGPAKEAESLDVIRRAGFRPEPCIDGVRLEAGALYRVPADRRVWFQGPCLRVGASSVHERLSLDRVLQSLARVWGRRGIVMAPELVGEDGERGMHAVRQAGGDVRGARGELAPSSNALDADRDSEPPASRTSPRSQRLAAPAFRVQRLFPCAPPVLGRLQAAAALAVRRAVARDRVRAWVPACKTGGLAYAVAMLLHDAVSRVGSGQRVQVFGTDPDEEALAVARAGRYPLGAASNVDPRLRAEYIRELEQGEGGGVAVCEPLREACFFSSHKLPRHAPFSRIDLLVCQRVFEGVAPSQRDEVVSELSCALRDGGVLFALDHRHYFQNGCFELRPEGHLEPRPMRVWVRPWPSAWRGARAEAEAVETGVARHAEGAVDAGTALGAAAGSTAESAAPAPGAHLARLQPAATPAPPVQTSPAPASPPLRSIQPSRAAQRTRPELELLVEAIGLPLVLLDDQLRVLHLSEAALRRFALSPSTRGSLLEAIAPQLPGRLELVDAAERALATGTSRELALCAGASTYLVRLSVGQRAGARLLALLFTDVSALEAATDRALLHRQQQGAVARLGELALGLCPPHTLLEEALSALEANIPGARAGVIIEHRRDVPHLTVLASRGLGRDPLGALRDSRAALDLVERVVTRAQSGEAAWLAESWKAAPPTAVPSAPQVDGAASSVRPVIEGGVAWPILEDRTLLGVVAVYSSRGGIDATEHRRFAQGVANALATAFARQRARQRARPRARGRRRHRQRRRSHGARPGPCPCAALGAGGRVPGDLVRHAGAGAALAAALPAAHAPGGRAVALRAPRRRQPALPRRGPLRRLERALARRARSRRGDGSGAARIGCGAACSPA